MYARRKYTADELALYRRANGLLLQLRLAGTLPAGVGLSAARRGYVVLDVVNQDDEWNESISIDTLGLTNAQLSHAMSTKIDYYHKRP